MRRKLRFEVERLEGKSLLSGTTTGLAASLVATPTTTSTGTSVALSFTETNVSNHAITVTYGPTDDGFSATLNGKSVWISNSGIEPQFLELDTLQPGKSITVTGTWDGHANAGLSPLSSQEGPAVSGTFTISNQLNPTVTTTVKIGTVATPPKTTGPVTVTTFPPTHIVPPMPTHRIS